MPEHSEVSCSFCGIKVPTSSGRIVAGPNVFICWDCIALCAGTIGDQKWFDEKVAAIRAQRENNAGGFLRRP